MKVLIVNSFFNQGGPPRIVRGIYDTLLEHGDECLLAAARATPAPDMETYRIASKREVYTAAVSSRLFDSEGLSCRAATRRLVDKIEEYDPDVVNLHNLHGYYVNYEILFNYLKRSGRPVVWTLHDCWAFTGHCAHFSYVGCGQWKGCCADTDPCPQRAAYPSSLGPSRAKRNFLAKRAAFTGVPNMRLVTPSSWLGKLVGESFLSEYPINVIHNGIDLEMFRPTSSCFLKEERAAGKRIVLGVAQNWAERKGFEDFLKLSGILGEEYRVVMVGLTDDQLRVLPNNVYGIGRTESAGQLAEVYTAASVFVNCTYQDNFPTVNIEALACGVPVATYDTGGSPEAVDGTCGVIVPQGDVAEMARAIERIVEGRFSADACLARSRLFRREDRYLDYRQLFVEMLESRR